MTPSISKQFQISFTHKESQTMKKFSLAFSLCSALLLGFTLSAQSSFIYPGKLAVRAGVGLAPTYFGAKSETNTPPVQLQVGYQLSRQFSLNAFAGYSSTTTGSRLFSDGLATYMTNKSLMTGLRAEVRHSLTQRLEMYGGALAGYNRTFISEYNSITHEKFQREEGKPTPYNPDAPKGQFLYSGFVGANYFLVKNMAVYGEIGYGISLASLGLTFRI